MSLSDTTLTILHVEDDSSLARLRQRARALLDWAERLAVKREERGELRQ